MIGKKARLTLWEDWVEIFGFILLIIGIIISLIVGSAVIAYALICVTGGIVGRNLHIRRNRRKLPFYIIIIAFLIGYIIGSRYGNSTVILIFFLIGLFISFYIHKAGYLE